MQCGRRPSTCVWAPVFTGACVPAPGKPTQRPQAVLSNGGVAMVTHRSITIRMPACFYSDDNGPIKKIQVIVAESGGKKPWQPSLLFKYTWVSMVFFCFKPREESRFTERHSVLSSRRQENRAWCQKRSEWVPQHLISSTFFPSQWRTFRMSPTGGVHILTILPRTWLTKVSPTPLVHLETGLHVSEAPWVCLEISSPWWGAITMQREHTSSARTMAAWKRTAAITYATALWSQTLYTCECKQARVRRHRIYVET